MAKTVCIDHSYDSILHSCVPAFTVTCVSVLGSWWF